MIQLKEKTYPSRPMLNADYINQLTMPQRLSAVLLTVASLFMQQNSQPAGGKLDSLLATRIARLLAWRRTWALAATLCRIHRQWFCQAESWRISGSRQTGVSGKTERSCRHPRHQLGTSRRSSRPIRRSRFTWGDWTYHGEHDRVQGFPVTVWSEANRRNLEDAARRRQ